MTTFKANTGGGGGGKEPSKEIVTGLELHSIEHPRQRQLLPQLQLQLMKQTTTSPSPHSLPPLSLLVMKTSNHITRVHHIPGKMLSNHLPTRHIITTTKLSHLYLSLNPLTIVTTRVLFHIILSLHTLTSEENNPAGRESR